MWNRFYSGLLPVAGDRAGRVVRHRVGHIFINWYNAIVSLSVISLIFGFAMQTTLSSFIGWVYILVREPYRVGDRIRIGR
jgi:amino acid transporter